MHNGSESIIELKTLPVWFEAAMQGKNFELRKDDRGIKQGDSIRLREWDGEKYTGRELQARTVRYVLRNCPEYGLIDGYCIIGF